MPPACLAPIRENLQSGVQQQATQDDNGSEQKHCQPHPRQSRRAFTHT